MIIIKNTLMVILIFFSSFSVANTLKIAQVENTPDQVLAVMLLAEIYAKVKIPVEFIKLPSARALKESSSGYIDGEAQRIYALGGFYPTLVRVPTSYTYSDVAYFTKKQNFVVSDWSSVNGYLVGRVRGMKFAELGLKDVENVIVLNDSAQMFQMIESDRLDFIVTGLFNGLYYLKSKRNNTVHQAEPSLERYPLYHYLHVKHQHLVPIIDQSIQDMQASGELDLLREKFTQQLLK